MRGVCCVGNAQRGELADEGGRMESDLETVAEKLCPVYTSSFGPHSELSSNLCHFSTDLAHIWTLWQSI